MFGFGKTCIIHTPDFEHLEIYKTTRNGIAIALKVL